MALRFISHDKSTLSLLFSIALALGACGPSPESTSSGSGGGGSDAGGSSAGGTDAGGSAGSSTAGTGGTSTAGAGGAGGTTGGAGGMAGSAGDMGGGPPGWDLAWSDEFNGPDGSTIDTSKWTALTGGDGWGNQELEYYTGDAANAHIEGNALQIVATKDGADQHSCWYGTCQFTSARLQTKGKFEQQNGRFEARIQVPRGQGIWPAFWMLGGNIDNAGWPACGEIDIMENIGKEPSVVHGSLHGPGYSGGSPLTGSYTLPGGAKLADDYHVFAVEWETDVIRFYIDDQLYETHTSADVPPGSAWAYDHPFFLLLNVAVGGGWPGSPDGSTVFPQRMSVDYVRVYKRP